MRIFLVVGLPKIVLIDAGSEFAGMVEQVCNMISVQYYKVTRGNHKAIISERVNKYINKIQKIHRSNTETYQDWIKGIMLGLYAWNAAPIDGLDITRSFAAMGREFRLPIDMVDEDNQ